MLTRKLDKITMPILYVGIPIKFLGSEERSSIELTVINIIVYKFIRVRNKSKLSLV